MPARPVESPSATCAGVRMYASPHMANRAPTIILAGGGSGGHVAPGLAIAEGLREIEPEVRVVFVCSERAIDASMLREAGETFVSLPARPFSAHPVKLVKFYRTFQSSRKSAKAILNREGARCVVALGGFVAAPVMAAARDLKLPRVLVNLDDPPGKANRMMALMGPRVLSAIDVASVRGFKHERVGFPIRERTIAPCEAIECRVRLGIAQDKPVLLVTGASQGASSINRLMIALADAQPEAFRGWQVVHLCGEGEIQGELERAYASAGVPAKVQPFTHEMGLAWGAAELAVSRAGANSVAEVSANAVPTVFLPYPYHKDQHQRRNAAPLVQAGGAMIVGDHIDARQNVEDAGTVIAELLSNEPKRRAMRESLAAHWTGNASREIAGTVLSMLTRPPSGRGETGGFLLR